ncbi:MAG TPA: class I SAM-dependent methyltransferase [Smithellaceae bacterium]|nr:class I SAM-dependent methyltransferase [Smithellaceae bacterium]
MKKVSEICALCGGADRTILYKKGEWSIYKCSGCGLGTLDPRPEKDELDKLYAESYFQSHYDETLPYPSAAMTKRLKQENHRLRFFRKFKKRGKILDIGCGRGYFLLACRNAGYEVEGIDISADAAKYVGTALKIPVHVGEVDQIELHDESFDVITLWHSLEHTADPDVYMQKARKWLKKDGVLVIDVPNYEGYDALQTWDDWQGWSIPYHFYHFTTNSLTYLLGKHGFAVIREKQYLSEHLKQKLQDAFVPSFIARIIARCYSGHSIAVVAGKNKC